MKRNWRSINEGDEKDSNRFVGYGGIGIVYRNSFAELKGVSEGIGFHLSPLRADTFVNLIRWKSTTIKVL